MPGRVTQDTSEVLVFRDPQPAVRASQEASEVLVFRDPQPALRLTQEATEVLVSLTPLDPARVSQEVLEVLQLRESTPTPRVSQEVLETLLQRTTPDPTRVTQEASEILMGLGVTKEHLIPTTFDVMASNQVVYTTGGRFDYAGLFGNMALNYRDDIINALLRGQNFTGIRGWLALLLDAASPTGIGTEVSGQGYKRRPVFFGPPSNGIATNPSRIKFPRVRASWGTITHYAICVDSTGPDIITFGTFASPVTPTNDSYFIINTGQLQIRLS